MTNRIIPALVLALGLAAAGSASAHPHRGNQVRIVQTGDDTTAVTLKIRKPEWVQVFTGPPDNPSKDKSAVMAFYEQTGKKIDKTSQQ